MASHPLTAAQRAELAEALHARQRALRADVAAKLKTQDDPRLVGLRNRMEDTDDWAAAGRLLQALTPTSGLVRPGRGRADRPPRDSPPGSAHGDTMRGGWRHGSKGGS